MDHTMNTPMRFPSKTLVSLLATVLMPLAAAQSAPGQWAPTKPVKVIVPIVGSTNDAIARLIQPALQEALGQPVIVENRPGAGGNIGADFVAKSPPDGHTILVGYNGPIAINPTLFAKMPFDPIKDLTPITLAVTSPQYLVVNAQLPIKTVAELVAYANANKGKVSYASVAMGSASHLTMEMLKSAASIDIEHIPYKGAAPALVDLVAGNVQSAFLVPGNVQQFVKDGRLRILATTGQKRSPQTPNIPTLIESGYPDFVATSWVGFLAPKGTPKEIVQRYNIEIVKILQSPAIRAQLQEMEFDVVATSPQDFSKWINTEVARWGKVIKATGAKVD
jgi:tripartite-type tricarboxylate transporter receptor subunit TctC